MATLLSLKIISEYVSMISLLPNSLASVSSQYSGVVNMNIAVPHALPLLPTIASYCRTEMFLVLTYTVRVLDEYVHFILAHLSKCLITSK